jgi:polyisoprenoid-binding protein YceI
MKALLRPVVVVVLLHFAAQLTHGGDQYKVDAVHSSVLFRIKHMSISYCYGRFNEVSGIFRLDKQNPVASEIDITVATDSIDTANTQRDAHSRNADFFDAPKYPTIRFQATKVGRTCARPFAVEGNPMMHGVTRPITIAIESTGAGKGMFGKMRTGLEAVFTIRRSDFGMDKRAGAIGDDVRLMVSLEGFRQ